MSDYLTEVYNFQENFEKTFKEHLNGTEGLRAFTSFDDVELPENFLFVQFLIGGATGNESSESIPYTGEIEQDTFRGSLNVSIVTSRSSSADSEVSIPSIIKYHSLLRAKIHQKLLRGRLKELTLPSYYVITTFDYEGTSISIEEDNWSDVSSFVFALEFKIVQWAQVSEDNSEETE